jgi:hypothetical protein
MAPGHRLPGFRGACTAVAVVYVLLGASMKLQGATGAMSQFRVPPEVLAAPHFIDFFQFTFLHQMVIGLLIGLMGWTVTEGKAQRRVAQALWAVQLVYVYVDLRTSDSPFGNGLYQGPGSLVPPVMGLVVAALFGVLALRRLRSASRSPPG